MFQIRCFRLHNSCPKSKLFLNVIIFLCSSLENLKKKNHDIDIEIIFEHFKHNLHNSLT